MPENEIGQSVAGLEQAIRDFINRHARFRSTLIKDPARWNTVCSAMDVIGDTELALDAYVRAPVTLPIDDRYLITYGVLQVLVVQQDAVRLLARSLGVQTTKSSELEKIRTIRNRTIGHPVKGKEDEIEFSNFISRASLRRGGFQMLTVYSDHRIGDFVDIDIMDLIRKQRDSLLVQLQSILQRIKNQETDYRHMLRNQKLSTILKAADYIAAKIGDAIFDHRFRPAGPSHITMLLDVIKDFEKALSDREELFDAPKYEIERARHALCRLADYFSANPELALNKADAEVFASFLYERVRSLLKIADELDAEYSQDA